MGEGAREFKARDLTLGIFDPFECRRQIKTLDPSAYTLSDTGPVQAVVCKREMAS